MISEAPVNAGHTFANDAEDFEERGQWAKAIEAHNNAAEQFQKAVDYAQDTEAAKTLQLLILTHQRKAKEFERKQRKAQAKNNSPVIQSVTNLGYTTMRGQDMNGLRNALPETRRFDPTQGHTISTGAIGDSYAVLSNDADEEKDTDPFNKFWEVVETLLDKLSNPVAFASAPLNDDDKPNTNRTDPEIHEETHKKHEMSAMLESYFVVPDHTSTETARTLPHKAEETWNINKNSSNDKMTENEQLKLKVEQLKRKIYCLEKTAEESNMLKSSILQFRNDVQKQAKRIMLNHDSIMRSSLGASSTDASIYNSYMRSSSVPLPDQALRLKELEEENRQLRSQNEKQQSLVNKYRERWEKLKESAKKRRSQPLEENVPRMSSTRQPTLLQSLAQQSSSNSSHPPFATPTAPK
ncbi:hypothetical protein BDF14DRAFT_1773834 [Spinellus fusiger]|nr:hypothetical protein BDF14DRAFT_1773834 [Spinellus fusiger]